MLRSMKLHLSGCPTDSAPSHQSLISTHHDVQSPHVTTEPSSFLHQPITTYRVPCHAITTSNRLQNTQNVQHKNVTTRVCKTRSTKPPRRQLLSNMHWRTREGNATRQRRQKREGKTKQPFRTHVQGRPRSTSRGRRKTRPRHQQRLRRTGQSTACPMIKCTKSPSCTSRTLGSPARSAVSGTERESGTHGQTLRGGTRLPVA